MVTSISRSMRFVIGAALTTLTAAVGAASPGAQQADKGEGIMNVACTTCHDLRPIQTQALDAEGWTSVVAAMVDKGAQVDKADTTPLVEYLAKTYGPLPEGAGKKILLNVCTVCHDLSRVKRHLATPEEWEDTLGAMLNE